MILRSPLARRLAFVAAAALLVASCGTAKRVGGALGSGDKDDKDRIEGERIAILSFDQSLEPDPALAASGVILPPPVLNTAWPMEGGAPDHALGHLQVNDNAKRAWRKNVGEGSSRKHRVAAPPIVADGKVFVVDGEGEIGAYSLADGDRIWRSELKSGSKRDKEWRGGGVAYGDGRVYGSFGFAAMVALDASTGKQIWRTDLESPMHAPPTVVDGRVFAVSVDNELFALDAASGETLWTYRSLAEPARILTASAPAVEGDVVVAPFASGEVVALRAQNGRVIWTQTLSRGDATTALSALNDIAGSPVIKDGVVYAMSHSGVIAAIDIRTGQIGWSRGAGGIHMPWVAGEQVFVVTTDAQVIAMNRRSGGVYWLTELPRYKKEKKKKGRIAWAGPVLAGGNLIVASSEGELAYLSPQSGEVLRTAKLGDSAFIPPVVAEGVTLFLTDEATLNAWR